MSSNMIVTHEFSMLKFTPIILLVIDLELVTSGYNRGLVCRPGSYLHTPRIGPDFCLPCRDGETFITEDLHSMRECHRCTQVVDLEKEVLVAPCNKTHDSEILCKPGFYRRRARNSLETDTCVLCSTCVVTTRPCQGYFDSVCCGHPDYEAVLHKHGFYICKEKPIRCGSGQYLRTSTEQCTPCPAHTYRPETDHNKTECLPCLDTDQDLFINRLVVRACNTSHPALFGCKPGFFGNASIEDWLLSEEDCRPCQICQFVGRQCDRHQDSVCCPYSDMVVSDTSQGPLCLKQEDQAIATTTGGYDAMELVFGVVTCGEGEFLQTDSKNESNHSHNQVSCKKCPAGTYNTDKNHSRTTCRNCSDLNDPRFSNACLLLQDRQSTDETETGFSAFQWEFACVVIVSVLHLIVLCIIAARHTSHLLQKFGMCFWYHIALSEIDVFFLIIVLVLCFCVRTSSLGSKVAVLILSGLVIITHIFFLFQLWKRSGKLYSKLESNKQDIPRTASRPPRSWVDVEKNNNEAKTLTMKQNNYENVNLLNNKTSNIRLSNSSPNLRDMCCSIV